MIKIKIIKWLIILLLINKIPNQYVKYHIPFSLPDIKKINTGTELV